MTLALCLYCGDIKFGAFSPCEICGSDSTGNADLDILFSDHRYTTKTLKQFGTVIKRIQVNTDNKEIGFWAFIHYISEKHPEIISANIPDDIKQYVENLINKYSFPDIKLEKSLNKK